MSEYALLFSKPWKHLLMSAWQDTRQQGQVEAGLKKTGSKIIATHALAVVHGEAQRAATMRVCDYASL